jgi:hypothetical protein
MLFTGKNNIYYKSHTGKIKQILKNIAIRRSNIEFSEFGDVFYTVIKKFCRYDDIVNFSESKFREMILIVKYNIFTKIKTKYYIYGNTFDNRFMCSTIGLPKNHEITDCCIPLKKILCTFYNENLRKFSKNLSNNIRNFDIVFRY